MVPEGSNFYGERTNRDSTRKPIFVIAKLIPVPSGFISDDSAGIVAGAKNLWEEALICIIPNSDIRSASPTGAVALGGGVLG